MGFSHFDIEPIIQENNMKELVRAGRAQSAHIITLEKSMAMLIECFNFKIKVKFYVF